MTKTSYFVIVLFSLVAVTFIANDVIKFARIESHLYKTDSTYSSIITKLTRIEDSLSNRNSIIVKQNEEYRTVIMNTDKKIKSLDINLQKLIKRNESTKVFVDSLPVPE